MEGQQILLFFKAAVAHQFRVVGRVVGHHQGGRGVKTLHQQAYLMVGGRIERAPKEFHVFISDPPFGCRKECGRNLRVTGTFEKTPYSHFFVVILVVVSVHYGGNPAHRFLPAFGQKQFPFGKAPEGMAFRVEQSGHAGFEWGDPVGVSVIYLPGKVNEGLHMCPARHRDDFNAGHGRTASRFGVGRFPLKAGFDVRPSSLNPSSCPL